MPAIQTTEANVATTETQATAPVAAPKKRAAKTAAVKATPKASVKKAPVKKAAKASNGQPVDQKTKEILWTPIKVTLLNNLKKLGATSATAAKTPEAIAKKGGIELGQVKHQLNPAFDLMQQEIIKRGAGEDSATYYATSKGLKALEKALAAG